MTEIISEKALEDKRIAGFWEQLKGLCRSRSSFMKHIEVDRRHIAFRAAQTNDPVRNSMHNEKIASVLTHGWLNRNHCRSEAPMEIAVEGKFENLEVIDTQKAALTTIEVICVRVVVRERRPRHLVVTVYPDRSGEIDPNITPKVPNEIW